ncbi:MAG: Modification methylase [Candidatus Uhrbacteria bacterium GW2011_GWF2_39_13]|uniref:site-specific DNA-methyltransferase (adenine-specific) n=1 Tax=Candidatus Uhrbacteria bacterium GW2011_GWF2_39_13 TaxID=1618995 RepID=A0A0G0MKU5_9BACT|nr:MAG: Modification methylase [Candidatus Uhrbacteria bacterium GW2011_GWF2_39_13]
MAKIKDIPKIDRPRERFLKKGSDALSKSDLLAILLGTGIKGKNVQQLSQQIIKKFGKDFLHITVEDLQEISGIGQAKALQITAAISLVKRFYDNNVTNEITIRNSQDVFSLNYDLRDKKKEHLVCLYLNARNVLLRKEIVSVGLLDKTLLHPREIFYPATELNAASVILVHNHPSNDPSPSKKDTQIVNKIAQAGEIMGIPVIDFIIVSLSGNYSFFEKLKDQNRSFDYVADGLQGTLFDLLEIEKTPYEVTINKIEKSHFHFSKARGNTFQLHNRRYLGNKHKLLGFIEDIVLEKCNGIKSFCDIFAGTGVVGERFNKPEIKVISNDLLFSNYACLKAFLGTSANFDKIAEKIEILNKLQATEDNYFSKYFGNTYFSLENARKIGAIREEIEKITETEEEKNTLICSLLYAVDKVANTVGHYDAFRKDLDMIQSVKLLTPDIDYSNNATNEIYKEDANILIRKISSDVLYIDPPYNSRQYSDAYHLLENLAEWKKPEVVGVAKKMDRSHIKSSYCLKNATQVFEDLIRNADCKHILLSYNNTGDSKDGRSNARISDNDILRILKNKGKVEIFERDYKAFTAGKSNGDGNAERIFYCKVN